MSREYASFREFAEVCEDFRRGRAAVRADIFFVVAVNGFGGFYGRLGETKDRWDSDFMNLVESENWTLYDYKAVCVPDTLVAYMAEKDCDYILIDRADDYLQREFSPLFEGGLTNDMPATLYHFEGADAAVPFKLAAVAESGVE